MFKFLRRDPLKKLETQYQRLLEEARDLQRAGDIKGFASKTAEAEEVSARIDELRAQP